MIIDRDDFVRRAKALADKRGLTFKALSKRLFTNTRTLPALIKGHGNPGIKTMEQAIVKLSELEAAQ